MGPALDRFGPAVAVTAAAHAVVGRRAGVASELSAGPPFPVELVDAAVAREGHEDKQTSHGVQYDVNESKDQAGRR